MSEVNANTRAQETLLTDSDVLYITNCTTDTLRDMLRLARARNDTAYALACANEILKREAVI